MFNHIATAKLAANLIVQAVAAKVAANLVINNTSAEEGDITVTVVAGVAGYAVGDALRARTDLIVEQAAVWIAEKKNSKVTQ